MRLQAEGGATNLHAPTNLYSPLKFQMLIIPVTTYVERLFSLFGNKQLPGGNLSNSFTGGTRRYKVVQVKELLATEMLKNPDLTRFSRTAAIQVYTSLNLHCTQK